jgi:hypothetical protein
MKLAAIYNVWDGLELLQGSIKCIKDHVDLIVIVYQDISNYGEIREPFPAIIDDKIELLKYDPTIEWGGNLNERAKRNLGIEFARMNHCTHFLHMDCDEYYEDFGTIKDAYFNCDHAGSVVRLKTYFKKPTFMLDPIEDYYVPFIHILREETKAGVSSYKFYVDPTRGINETEVIELPFFMHHFSWVRHDIMKKARNSSANVNNMLVKNEQIFKDYNSPDIGEGYLVSNWNRKIKVVPDIFGLSKIFT